MRIMGHNVLAIIVAALAIFGLGTVIYGFAFTDLWIASTPWTEQDLQSSGAKMAYMGVMPVLLAIGLSLVIKWRDRPGWISGAATGFWIALFFLFAERLYGYVYAPSGGETWLAIDSLYAFASGVVGGAILGAWK